MAGDDDGTSLPDITTFNDFGYAFPIFAKMKATDFHFLPEQGALLDQDEALWEDIMKLAMLEHRIDRLVNPPNRK